MPAQGGHHRSGVFAGHLHQHAETRMTLHQSGDVTVARPAQQIALPMPGNGTIFDFRRSVADGDSIHDPALGVSVNAGVPPFRFPFPIVEFRRYSAVMDANRRVTNAKEDASKPEELALVLARKIDALAQTLESARLPYRVLLFTA